MLLGLLLTLFFYYSHNNFGQALFDLPEYNDHFQDVLLFTQAHLDVTCWAYVRTNVAAYTAVIIGIDITTESMLVFFHFEYGILWAEDNAVVTFEAHAAAHATLGFLNGLFF